MTLLDVSDLRVSFATRHGTVPALRGVGFALEAGQTLGIVGESGSGKSVTSLAIMRLLDRAGRVEGGRVLFRGRDIAWAGPGEMRGLRGAAMSMIFQNPRLALNPIRTVGQQITDVLHAHRRVSAPAARAQALSLLQAVQIRDPEARLRAYPAELSGGMCQRVMIAMAMACEPDLLIADEPTTGLDVTTQRTVMDLLSGLVTERGMAMILITHDLGLAARYCGAIAVMEHGLVVERGPTEALFRAPVHPYTQRLIAASPTRHSTLADLAHGERAAAVPPRVRPPGTGVLLDLRHVTKTFPGPVHAVADVSFALPQGGSLGLVGESGSGKSTLSRLACRLIDADAGDIIFAGEDIGAIPAREFHRSPHRRDIQIVFQDPHESLNPRFTAFDCIAHPLRRLERMRDGGALRAGLWKRPPAPGCPRTCLAAIRTSSRAGRRRASGSPAPSPPVPGC